jgi:hypothetical protein
VAKPHVNVDDADLPTDFTEKAERRMELSKQAKALEAEINEINEYLKVMMDVSGVEKVLAGRAMVSRSVSTRSTIKPERLLEKGVDMEVIEYATVATQSESLTIKEYGE